MYMTRKNNGFVINIDWKSEDAGYSVLTSKKMIRFALYNKNNLIQTYKPFKLGKTKLYLRAVSVQTWPNTPTWDEINCKTKPITKLFKQRPKNHEQPNLKHHWIRIFQNEHQTGCITLRFI